MRQDGSPVAQQVTPDEHSQRQAPPAHNIALQHALPHSPQFSESMAKSTHSSPHWV